MLLCLCLCVGMISLLRMGGGVRGCGRVVLTADNVIGNIYGGRSGSIACDEFIFCVEVVKSSNLDPSAAGLPLNEMGHLV